MLVYPAIGLHGFNMPFNGESSWIHHGLGLISSNLKANGYDVDFVDMRRCSCWDTFKNKLFESNPDVVGVSISYVDKDVAVEAIKVIKSCLPDVKIIVGGFAPSIFPELFIDNPNIDYIVRGEGEVTFVDILRYMPNIKVIDGVKPNLDALPFVDRDIYTYHYEMHVPFAPCQPKPMVTIIAGRGCPYRCSYCQGAESQLYGKFRIRSVESVMEELRQLYDKYSFKSITFWDDTFTIDAKWVDKFCNLYEKHYTADIVACSRADIICNNEDMIKRLAHVGLKWLVIGFETGTQRMLDFIKKGTTVEQNYKAAEICRKYGIKIFGTFMVGLPTETKEDSLATIEMIKKIKPDHPSLFYFTPIPGTDIYDYCNENDLMIRKDALKIERTGDVVPKIYGINYNYLEKIRIGVA
jgi:anaerobic magnesium-protoporphyrin IX monomethyl ester cyclase